MNPCYEESVDKNFSRAVELCSTTFSRDELFAFLQNGNMPEKQFAALEIDSVQTQNEADILMKNLTGCDGKIREAVAFKLSEVIPCCKELFLKYPDIFADATIDINANICRIIIESLPYLKDREFAIAYTNKMYKFIDEAFAQLDSFIFRDKKYTINKQLFKLYWCLEGLNVFFDFLDEEKLYKVLSKCAEISEYTIREKTALLLCNNIQSAQLIELRQALKNDTNYYVRALYVRP